MNKLETFAAEADLGLTPNDQKLAMDAFFQFTQLPERQKSLIVFEGLPGRERNTKSGYVRKTLKDKKQIFHYTDALAEHIAGSPLPTEARQFMSIAGEVHYIALRGIRQALKDWHPLLASVHYPPNGDNNHHTRFGLYDNAEEGTVIAAGHYDQSDITVAICESEEGLRLGTSPTDLAAYNRDPHQPVMFLGRAWLNLHKLLGLTTEYVPTWHDVVMPRRTVPKETGRLMIVHFANPAHLDTAPSKQETATPLTYDEIQELEQEGVLTRRVDPNAA